jgi:hypothetical protein
VDVLEVEQYVALVALLGMLVLKAFALTNALLWPSSAYALTLRWSKARWLGLLALALGTDVLLLRHPVTPVSVVLLVPALVYVLDVRPAVAAITRRR